MKDLARKKVKKNPNGTYLAYNAAKDIEESKNLSKYLVQINDDQSVSISLCTETTPMPELAIVDNIEVAKHIIDIFDNIEYNSLMLIDKLKGHEDIRLDQRYNLYKEFIDEQEEIIRYRDQLDDRTILNLKFIDSYREVINIFETYRVGYREPLEVKYNFNNFHIRCVLQWMDHDCNLNKIDLNEDISRDRNRFCAFYQYKKGLVVAVTSLRGVCALLAPRVYDNKEKKNYSDFYILFEADIGEKFPPKNIIINNTNSSMEDYLCSISMGIFIIGKFRDEICLIEGGTISEKEITQYEIKYGILRKKYDIIRKILEYIPTWARQYLYDIGVLKEINKKLERLGVTDIYTMKGRAGRHSTGRRYIKYWVSTEEDVAIKELLEKMRYPNGRKEKKSRSKNAIVAKDESSEYREFLYREYNMELEGHPPRMTPEREKYFASLLYYSEQNKRKNKTDGIGDTKDDNIIGEDTDK